MGVLVGTNSSGDSSRPQERRQACVGVNEDKRRRRTAGYCADWNAARADTLHARRVLSLRPEIGLNRKKKSKQKCNTYCGNREKRRQHQHTHLLRGRAITTVSSVYSFDWIPWGLNDE
jgi:hypothetical protein